MASAGNEGRGGVQEIEISQLSLSQLNQLSQQLEEEIEFLQSSLAQLKMAQQKFAESKDALKTFSPANKGKEILVPLTSSMYVAGQLYDDEKVLVDIGTGYYTEKSVAEAAAYFQRKVDYVTKQMLKVQPLLQDKASTKQVIVEVMQMKIQAQVQQQGPSGSAVPAALGK